MFAVLYRALSHGAAVFAFVAASHVSAADVALVIGNADYRNMDDIRDARDLKDIAQDLADQGFEVIAAFDQDTSRLVEAAHRFRSRSLEADRTLVILSGHIATSSSDAWLIGTEGRRPDFLSVSQQGLSLTSLAGIASLTAGRAVILVGPGGSSDAFGSGLNVGTRGIELPQGVTLARGSVRDLRSAIFNGLMQEGQSLDKALGNLAARGFLSKNVGYSQGKRSSGAGSDALVARSQEEGFWEATRALNTAQSMRLYLNTYPGGRFVGDARARIAALENDRQDRWRRAEEELGFNRDDRRRIQRQLTLLGFGTRGVDGIFGRGTRNAISSWQAKNDFEETGFLNQRQVRVLSRQARVVEQEKAAESARQDDDYWQRTGAEGTIRGLRTYLERYPRGNHAEEARARLAVLEEQAREDQAAEARDAWRRARDIGTVQAYRDFLERYPDSRDADRARARIRELQEASNGDLIKHARKEEKEILKNSLTRLLVEQRLIQMGYRPGVPDGDFTEKTRDALRAFQRDRKLFQSGYVTNRTAGFLLSGR